MTAVIKAVPPTVRVLCSSIVWGPTASLPLTQGSPAVPHDTIRLCWFITLDVEIESAYTGYSCNHS